MAVVILALVVTSALVLSNLTTGLSAEGAHRLAAGRLAARLMAESLLTAGAVKPEGDATLEGTPFRWTIQEEPLPGFSISRRVVRVTWYERGAELALVLEEAVRKSTPRTIH